MRVVSVVWYPQMESDHHFRFRKPAFYPLNYGDENMGHRRYRYGGQVGDTGFEPATSASRTLRASQLRQSPIKTIVL